MNKDNDGQGTVDRGIIDNTPDLEPALEQGLPTFLVEQAASPLKSLFFVSLPKSGTVYTWYALEKATGLKVPSFHELPGWHEYSAGRDFSCPHLYACGDYNTQLLRPDAMRYYANGLIFGGHMQASYHNMKILKESGIDRVAVLLRDPRDAFVSWVHHLRKLGPTARNYHSKIYSLPAAYYDWDLARQFAYQIRTFLPTTVNWIEGWLDYYASAEREVDILFVYYDELKRDPKSYLGRMLDFYRFSGGNLDEIIPGEPGKLHYRKGEHGQWRQEFASGDQALVEDLMQDRIPQGFATAATAHPGRLAASEAEQRGALGEAARALLDVLTQFPNDRSTYQLFIQTGQRAGFDMGGLETALAEELSDRVEDQFIQRENLLALCRTLLPGQ